VIDLVAELVQVTGWKDSSVCDDLWCVWARCLTGCLTRVRAVLQARGLMAADVRGTSDPYCVIQLINSRRQAHTEYRTLSPVWNRSFTLYVRLGLVMW